MSFRRIGARTALTAVVCGVGLLAAAGSALAETKEFKYTGEEQKFEVPVGVTSVQVMAIGGAGGSGFNFGGVLAGAGGQGAVVSGNLGVKAGETLYVEVGGNGISPEAGLRAGAGGFNGGGSSGLSGGGGGASDVRTVSIGAEPSPGNEASLQKRLLVAAGGGGGGGVACSTGSGGAGGSAEQEGHEGTGCGAFGGGGGAGTLTKPGTGGTSSGEQPGNEGAIGTGGNGTTGKDSGGGGGGGLYGGGSGGEGVAAGGGGGGSNLVPPGGRAEGLAEAAPEGGLVTITYTALPTSIEQCTKNGWKNFGTKFKNQGQCVKFVETGR